MKYEKDSRLLLRFNAFLEVVEANLAELNITQAEMDELTALKNQLERDSNDKIEKRQAALAAKTRYKETRNDVAARLSQYNQTFNLNKVPDSLILNLGFEKKGSNRAPINPQTPLELLVEGYADGRNGLKWKRNGNNYQTIFIIEALIGDATDFVIVGSTMKTKFVHHNQKPGVRVVYRVAAQRNGRHSVHSNEAIIY